MNRRSIYFGPRQYNAELSRLLILRFDLDSGVNDLIFLHIFKKRQLKCFDFQYMYSCYIKCLMIVTL